MVRTIPQQEFDGHARGWAFSDRGMLSRKIELCETASRELDEDDVRHETLTSMREALAETEEAK